MSTEKSVWRPHQAHSQPCTENYIRCKAKPGPPLRNTGFVDEEVTDEVKDAVTNKSSDHQPIVPLEAENGKQHENACNTVVRMSESVACPGNAIPNACMSLPDKSVSGG